MPSDARIRRIPLAVTALVLILAGLLLPRDWYDALPWGPDLPPQPLRGVTLLQLAMVLQGVALLWWSRRQVLFRSLAPTALASGPAADPGDDAWGARLALLGVTLLGAALRFAHAGSGLWLDEIAPLMDYASLSPFHVVASYQRSNNHLLNTLLVKASVALFGEQEWAIRLPAILFGSATVPALYWACRETVGRRVALGAAFLLAVSYHHIFFSQNARGYAGYMLFAIAASGFLVSGLQRDRPRDWVLYVAAMYLGFASQLLTTFVYIAHALVGIAALIQVWSRGDSPAPLCRRLTGVFAILGLLVFQLYALILPQAYVVAKTTYGADASGFRPFTMEFLQEIVKGVSAGFGAGLLLAAIPVLALGAVGFVGLLRRRWLLGAALAVPLLTTAAFLLLRGYTFSPRFFLLAVPLTMLCAAQSIESATNFLGGRRPSGARLAPRLVSVATLLLGCLSAAALGPYYRTPKQDYRAAVGYLEVTRRPGDAIVVFGIAERGMQFYARKAGVADSDYTYLRDIDALHRLVASDTARRVFVVTTFMRDLRLTYPSLDAELRTTWVERARFAGTVGDGAVLVFTSPRT